MDFDALWAELAPIGRYAGTGGYRRFSWTVADAECRAWFTERATGLGLDVRADRNGNLWAWWGDPAAGDAVATGSHLDSVPDGGAFDGPLGVVTALAAVGRLRESGARPRRPVAVVAFVEEEGARFGVPCLGSRLLTGAIGPEWSGGLRDADGVSWAEAYAAAGGEPEAMGADPELLGRLGTFVELHVEQGRGLVERGAAVGVASSIWPHGRWRMDFSGAADHAGTTRLADRRDPMLPFASTVLAAREEAAIAGAVATVGKVFVEPNGTNAIPSAVHAWLDARAPDEAALEATVAGVLGAARRYAAKERVEFAESRESYTGEVEFETGLRDRLSLLLGGAPILGTGAGHDAGVLSAHVPTAMLFVRNPTGISHSPAEHAETADRHAGVAALTRVLEELACA
ncbi:MAG: allantoate amidohydrolase [Streptosporangiales bacterium]|nr:allantoate amidohydrolase [Streptosporangiales bacterium]